MTLTKALKSRLFVNLVSKFEDEEYEGVLLEMTDQWCILASIEEFNPDGFWIIRKDTIKQVRHRPYEAFRHRILQTDGTLSALQTLDPIDLSTTSSLFASLVQLRNYVIIHRETNTDWWTHHAALIEFKDNVLLMHSFDGAGRFLKNPARCEASTVTSIRIGNRYLQTYQKAAPYNFAKRQPVSLDH